MNASTRTAPIVKTDAGALAGRTTADGRVHVFKGVPYALPPVGERRWRAPEPARSWSGTWNADRFGARCPQRERPTNSIGWFGPEDESEDCLFLNIWTPTLDSGAKRPVMVWFHGGSFALGSGALPIFDGANLARRGIVLVTVNYRLGALGFLAHPELSRDQEVCANFGLLDQTEALSWLQRNVANFGGDPGRVTIFGQSAGSSSVNCLMASPLARSLFHRAIGESGGSIGPLGKPGGGSMMSLESAERAGLVTARGLGYPSLAELRAAPAREIQLAWPTDRGSRPWPVVDGRLIPTALADLFEAGRQHDVPLLTGANADEGSARAPAASSEDWLSALRRAFGDDAEEIFECYGGARDVANQSRRQGGHATFNWTNWTWARMHSRAAKSSVYAYHFRRAPPTPRDNAWAENDASRFGAFHASEIPYVFGTLSARPWAWSECDARLSELMSSYWVNFAERGDPNGPGLPNWPALESGRPIVQLIGETVEPGELPDLALMRNWDRWIASVRARGGFASA